MIGCRTRVVGVIAWLLFAGLLRRGDLHWGGEQVSVLTSPSPRSSRSFAAATGSQRPYPASSRSHGQRNATTRVVRLFGSSLGSPSSAQDWCGMLGSLDPGFDSGRSQGSRTPELRPAVERSFVWRAYVSRARYEERGASKHKRRRWVWFGINRGRILLV